ncbi:hypothetical protein H310_11960 [Aphanomyces invadans]|uniref:DDE-1 domain-containing protein n=1 Tax=Aphanomyces invadans TaxID=157072 RepID=A0A024TJJ2_9STRA|nr:hypothetical protein H310_11960 [Aphanomyces invadans]ETV94310.1 hypothetical protein H310_11960 [Aphanomyces invadans]|eukprot:XP_008877072.1 hypothetical protein H310_11960 [Aphanomyces invadans]
MMPEVEQSVAQWVLQCEELGVCLNGELVRKQATIVCGQLQVPLDQRLKIQHGEAASVPPEAVASGRVAVRNITRGFNASEVYNMAETAFFYRMSPHRSITRSRVPGTKKSKDSITIAFITNADGSDVVDRFSSGRLPVHAASMKAWMNSSLFTSYLRNLDDRMATKGRNIFMLIDNAPSHKVDEDVHLSNVKVKMLPKNTTAHLQPQDAGIIASFKAKLKQRQLQNALDQIDNVMSGRQTNLYDVPLVEAMGWAKEAWRSVTQSTVVNCWNRVGILDNDY